MGSLPLVLPVRCWGRIAPNYFGVSSAAFFNKKVFFLPVRTMGIGFSSANTTRTPEEASSFVTDTVRANHVAIFSKTNCPHCLRVKRIFVDLGVQPLFIELNQRSDEILLKEALVNLTGVKTVPQVFVNGRFVGGADATSSLHRSGELLEKLKAMHIL